MNHNRRQSDRSHRARSVPAGCEALEPRQLFSATVLSADAGDYFYVSGDSTYHNGESSLTLHPVTFAEYGEVTINIYGHGNYNPDDRGTTNVLFSFYADLNGNGQLDDDEGSAPVFPSPYLRMSGEHHGFTSTTARVEGGDYLIAAQTYGYATTNPGSSTSIFRTTYDLDIYFAPTAAPAPDIAVRAHPSTSYIADGETTPFDLGSATEGSPSEWKGFEISNEGDAALELGQITVPTGFDVDLLGETELDAGQLSSFLLRLKATEVGSYSGNVVINSNDPDQPAFTFAVTGEVVAAEAAADPAISDFDGDGRNDLVLRRGAAGQTWAHDLGGVTTALPRLVDANWKIAGTGDFDGDGDADLLFRNSANGRIAIWRMDGAARVGVVNLPVAHGWKIGGVADFNGDGTADIFLRHSNDGRNAIWTLDDAGFVSSTLTQPLANRNWVAAGAGDFDADGHGDVLFRHAATGDNAVWHFTGHTFSRVEHMAALPDQNWQVADVKDFNGDGNADVVWRNAQTGRNVLWAMQHATLLSATPVAGFSDLNWLTPGQAEQAPAAATAPVLGWWQRQQQQQQAKAKGAAAAPADALVDLEPLVTLATVA